MVRKDGLDTERVGGVGAEGEREATFVARLLTTGRNDSGMARKGGLDSTLEVRE